MNSDNRIKGEVLNILKYFDAYCQKRGIRYYLAYGTLLGAIRHKGFIPWDDDIDVILTTGEYYRLKDCATEAPFLDEDKRYRIRLPGDADYCYPYIKVEDTNYKIREQNIADKYSTGLFIDVFRVDYWPESHLIETFQLIKARTILKLNEICVRGNIAPGKYRIIDKMLKPVDIIYRIFGLKTGSFCRLLESQGRRNIKSRYMGNIMSGSGRRSERIDADILDDQVYVEFEGLRFPAPAQYDAYLRSIYGDYMVIPDREHQTGHEYNIIADKGRNMINDCT